MLALLLFGMLWPANVSASDLELTGPVREGLHRLQDAWQRFTSAYYRDEQEMAETAVEEMLSITEYLGMSRLPDLSMAAAAYAVVSAEEGNADRAQWALKAAEQLDPGRPETEFARASVLRLGGDYVGSIKSSVGAITRLAKSEPERRFASHNLVLWALYSVLLAGGLFVGLQMVTKGPELLGDLKGYLPAGVGGPVAIAVLAVLLIWPLFLPSGLLCLVLYWSILLWGYGSVSERGVVIALWLVLGATPAMIAFHHRHVQLDLAPPTRALEALSSGRLYGSLFSDISVLRNSLPQSTAVLEVLADLHRRFGQWDYARPLYNELIAHPEQSVRQTATSLTNLGVFHHQNADYATAITYFQAAGEANGGLAAAFFNLSQAFSQSYDFANSNQALATAKEIDNALVESWLNSSRQEDAASSVFPVEGGLMRVDEIRQELLSVWSGGGGSESSIVLWGRYLSLGAALGALIMALLWDRVRHRKKLASKTHSLGELDLEAGWLRALIPGLTSAQNGHGVRALLALLLPVMIVLVPTTIIRGYRLPIGYEVGLGWIVGGLSVLMLFLVLLVRMRLTMGEDS